MGFFDGWIDWTKTTRSRNYKGSASFATLMIIGPTCFFLGILFASFPYDFPLLWSKEPLTAEFLPQLESHLKFMHAAPPLISRMLNIMVFVAFAGLIIKLFRPSEANFLFDGASLILYVIGAATYMTNIVRGLRALTDGVWDQPEFAKTRRGETDGEYILGKEDSLRVMSASNTILALVLIGVLVLQAGEWYAEKRDRDEDEAAELKKEAQSGPASPKSPKKSKKRD
ncbi:hypothetical protein PWT90_06968 [Aphanocladium album]|nr:hypothetical protein PWT90_06968 [Aphanocladium album]